MAKIKLKPRVASEAIITNVVTPHDTNHLGTLFGGTLMAWIDTAAGICAMRYAKATEGSAIERCKEPHSKERSANRSELESERYKEPRSTVELESGKESHKRSAVVTAAVDALQFAQPVKLGWIVTAQARINYVGNTSCEVGVRVMAEDMQNGVTVHAASAYLTMVALDARGRPCPLPPLVVRSAEDKRRRRAAETRRAMRLALQRRTATEAKT